ncbi:MAG TPA: DUF4198 domain-containing protein [Rhodocyclaceae bacterium]|nr:DUF4198 domain-containing protein [Rhodocyclaceae bacterium]
MNAIYKKVVLSVLLAGLFPMTAHAHRTWLLPSSTVLEGKEPWITVDAAVSEDLFDFDTNAQKLDDLVVFGPDGKRVAPENQFTGKLRSSFDLKLSQAGTYRISMVSTSIMASYKLNGEQKRWRGTEAAMSKEIPADATDVQVTRMLGRQDTFVTLNKTTDTVLKPSGEGLELVPITHPNELVAGEKARFRFLLDGKPLAKHLFGVIPGGVRYRGVLKEIPITTDDKGEFSVNWPAPGMYWINASYPARVQVPAGQTPAPVARRVSYSATLEVLPQ